MSTSTSSARVSGETSFPEPRIGSTSDATRLSHEASFLNFYGTEIASVFRKEKLKAAAIEDRDSITTVKFSQAHPDESEVAQHDRTTGMGTALKRAKWNQ